MAEKDRSNKTAPNDKISRELKVTVASVFRHVIEEAESRPLTAAEEESLSTGIVIVDADIPREEYEFNLVSELMDRGMTLKAAEVQAKKESDLAYED